MASCCVPVSSYLELGAIFSRVADNVAVKRSVGACETFLGSSNRTLSAGSSKGGVTWTGGQSRRWRHDLSVKVQAAGDEGLKKSDKWGEPVSLGTALLPGDVDLGKLEALLFQWGNSLTANANLPLPTPIKVDKVKGGVRLGYIRVKDGAVEDLVHIDVVVNPASEGSKAYFQASRNGQYKNQVPPGEPMIMQSLLAALNKSIQLARV